MAPQSALDVPPYDRIERFALATAIIAAIVFAIIAFTPLAGEFPLTQAATSYLVAFTFWFGVPMGCLVVLMIQYLSGGSWGVLLRPVLEASIRTLGLIAVLFIPIAVAFFFGALSPYPWARPLEMVATGDVLEELRNRAWLLNPPFALGRAVVYFAVWITIALLLLRWSARWRGGDAAAGERLPGFSGPGLILYAIFISFAAIDWVLSLEPFFISTMFPPIYAIGQINSGFAFATAAVILLSKYPPLRGRVTDKLRRDLGGLLLTFIIFWAYFTFSQFILIWAGNLPEETPYYLKRLSGAWGGIGISLIALRFLVPFLLLLFRDIKDHGPTLFCVAIGVMVMQFIDTLWWIEPAFPHTESSWFWLLDVSGLFSLGGLWVWWLSGIIRRTSLEPVHGPHQCGAEIT